MKKDKFKFKYKARSADDIKKRAEQTGGRFDSPVKRGFDMWRPKAGENQIRILPPTWDDFDHYGYEVFMHRYVGSDSSNYVCPNKLRGKACCMCDEAKQLKADGEDDEAKKIGYQKRVWTWIIDRDDKSETPQIWDMSWSQDRDISEQSRYKSGKYLLIDHPDDGYDVVVKKTGSGKNGTKYFFSIDREASPISDDEKKQEEILKFITENPIPTTIQLFSNEHLQKKMEGTGSEKDEDLDDDEDGGKSKKRKRSRDEDEDDADEKPKRRRSRDEDEEEQEDPPKRKKRASEDDDDEEDDTPRRSKRRASEDDDDEDEAPRKKKRPAEDEDDEDEPPKRKRRASEDDEEDEPPKKKRRASEEDDEDEDERPKRKKRASEEDDDEDEPPKKKKRASEDDDDEDDTPRRRRR
jgi:hypothetical protein